MALEILCPRVHIRNFPLILSFNGWIVNKQCEAFKLAISLHELTERLTAEQIRPHELELLDEVIVGYLDQRKGVFAEQEILGTCKPKHHFLSHYKVGFCQMFTVYHFPHQSSI